MIPNNRTLRCIILTVLGSWFAIELYKSFQLESIFDAFVFLFIGIVGIPYWLWIILKDYEENQVTKSIISFFPSFTGLFFFLTIITLFFYQNKRLSSTSLLVAYYFEGDLSSFSIDFKKNGKYIVKTGSIMTNEYYYGDYSIKDSFITLDKSNIGNIINASKLLIRPITGFNENGLTMKTTHSSRIVQFDNNDKERDTYYSLWVTLDNRKKNKIE